MNRPDNRRYIESFSGASPVPFWLDRPRPLPPLPPLAGSASADLLVVGAGFTGLWTALQAKESDPSLDVMVVDQGEVGAAASGRNGGFCMSTLTHGISNGVERWPQEMMAIERMGLENLAGIGDTIARYGIDCDWRLAGEVNIATQPWQVEGLREDVKLAAGVGRNIAFLDRDEVLAEVRSPTYLAATWDKEGAAMVDPARLAWGLAQACLALGVRIHERTSVTGLEADSGAVLVRTQFGNVRTNKVAIGTNAFPSPLRSVRRYIVPVYDYVLATEPIPPERWSEIGWGSRAGLADAGSRFHYYSSTEDGRILWGGYDAIYHYGNGLGPELDQRSATFALLAQHFYETFPQLEGIRFTHTWGGAIDVCTRFAPMFGTALGGKVSFAVGYTGMGVGASRFGARVMLDLLSGEPTERTRLQMVQRKPVPFPPEPLRWTGIQLTRRAIARADEHDGRRGPWLRTLDRLGIGFDT